MRLRQFIVPVAVTSLAFAAIERAQSRAGQTDPGTTVVRAKAFELVDDAGRVRMEIKVQPAQPNFKFSDGTVGYPESVLLRMFTSHGAPNIKIAATEDGAEAGFVGQKGDVALKCRSHADPSITTSAKDGRERILKP